MTSYDMKFIRELINPQSVLPAFGTSPASIPISAFRGFITPLSIWKLLSSTPLLLSPMGVRYLVIFLLSLRPSFICPLNEYEARKVIAGKQRDVV